MTGWQSRVRAWLKPVHDLCFSRAYRNFRFLKAQKSLQSQWSLAVPLVLQIEPTNRCMLACVSCARNHWDRCLNQGSDLDSQLLHRLDFLYPHLSEVIIGGYGEPTSAKAFRSVFDWASRSSHMKVSMISNGIGIEAFREELGRLNTLILSVDGVEQCYTSQRGIPFHRFEKSVRTVVREFPSLPLEVNVVWNRTTHENLMTMIPWLQLWKVRRVRLAPERMYSASRKDFSLFRLSRLHNVIQDVQKFSAALGVPVDYPELVGWESGCSQPLETLYLCHDGELLACCSAVFKGGNPRFSLGFLQDISGWFSFYKLWNQEKLRRFRRAFFCKGEYPGTCPGCSFRICREETLERWQEELHG